MEPFAAPLSPSLSVSLYEPRARYQGFYLLLSLSGTRCLPGPEQWALSRPLSCHDMTLQLRRDDHIAYLNYLSRHSGSAISMGRVAHQPPKIHERRSATLRRHLLPTARRRDQLRPPLPAGRLIPKPRHMHVCMYLRRLRTAGTSDKGQGGHGKARIPRLRLGAEPAPSGHALLLP